MDEIGVLAYLLPSSLQENNGMYELDGPGETLNDLKLSLMANQSDEIIISRVVAYLALVIRYARAWLFNEHSNQYAHSDLLWSIAIGQPADQALSIESKELFTRIGNLAWQLSMTEKSLNSKFVLDQWKSFQGNHFSSEYVECLIIPELAAQIHGFINSDNFDPRKPNIFLMIDVGAGTLDFSIFSVRISDDGLKNFNLFINSVQPHGVANFHRHRVNWWQKKLATHDEGKNTIQELEHIKMPTEFQGFYPTTYIEYINHVEVDLLNGALSPDLEYDGKITSQIYGCLIKSIKSDPVDGCRLLREIDFDGMEYFLCGGGSRHQNFKKINQLLQSPKGWSWLKLKQRILTIPSDIRVVGVKDDDYDRLSVAYGLSQLNFGAVIEVSAMPSLKDDNDSNWNSNYIDKDLC